jgi:cell wall-associated NlpC family hydrolase
MRLSRPFLPALVLLALAFPASAAAEEAQLGATDAVQDVAPMLEHTVISKAGEQIDEKPVGRPRIVQIAFRYRGTPYRWAGSSPSGFDCSGFVMYVYGRIGIELPHNSTQLWGFGKPVAHRNLQTGDIVFFNGLSHVGIYIGHGRFIHSPHSGDVVRVQRLWGSRYGRTYDGARRPLSTGVGRDV